MPERSLYKSNMRRMKIIVDPRIELLTALQAIDGAPNIERSDSQYYLDMISWFSSYQDHPAVSYYKSANEYYCFDAFPGTRRGFAIEP